MIGPVTRALYEAQFTSNFLPRVAIGSYGEFEPQSSQQAAVLHYILFIRNIQACGSFVPFIEKLDKIDIEVSCQIYFG